MDPKEFLAYTGMGEGVFLAGVAQSYGVTIDVEKTKAAFFDRYLSEYCNGSVNIGYPGAAELVTACKERGLKVAVASAADRVKVDGNLKAGGIDIGMFDAVVSADQFEGKCQQPYRAVQHSGGNACLNLDRGGQAAASVCH